MYHGGKLDQALRLASDILASQADIFHAYDTKVDPINKRRLCLGVESYVNSQARLHTVVEALGEGSDDETIHPSLFMTLLVIALVGKQKGDDSGLEDARKIFHVLRSRISSQLKGFPLLALRYEIDLASVQRPGENDRYVNAVRDLETIERSQWRTWGTLNACTALARRELITAQCLLAKWADPELHPSRISERDSEIQSGKTAPIIRKIC
ncbi:hypothetical protein PG994_004929 [Apiospora phragmitis]|uniref:Uncharacterized protein n=1 Tax=Apiospora phragmitis TaxID=2905665 RepID=A0ABR1VV04_9PEZI